MYLSDPTYPLFPIFSFLSFVLVLVPLPWHLQAWNAGTVLYMLWTAVSCLNLFINSIVWHGNAFNPSPVWCDISSRLIVGTSVAIPAASLCISRRLYKIASAQTLSVSREDKRRAVIEDLCIGLGIPFLQTILEYIVSGRRYDVYEDIGCYPVVVNVWLAYPLVMAWPLVIGLVSAVYCMLTLRAFSRRRIQFREFIASNTTLTVNRYFRLTALAMTDLICTVPFAVYLLYLNASSGQVEIHYSWTAVHWQYSKIFQIPSLIWRSDPNVLVAMELSRWLSVVCGFIFFAFFGFADEARKQYVSAFWFVAKRLGFQRSPSSKSFFEKSYKSGMSSSAGSIPVFIPHFLKSPRQSSFGSSTASSPGGRTLRSPTSSIPEFFPEIKLPIQVEDSGLHHDYENFSPHSQCIVTPDIPVEQRV